MLNPIEGTFKIREEAKRFFSQMHWGYFYHIIDAKDGKYFISPLKTNGKPPSFSTISRLGQWAKAEYFEII